MIVDEKNIVIGNNALETVAQPEVIREQPTTQPQKKKKRNPQTKPHANPLYWAKAMGMVLSVFALGVVVMLRYGNIYVAQSEISSMKSEISTYKSENEALVLELMKSQNRDEIERYAVEELGMVQPQQEDILYIEMDKNYLLDLPDEVTEVDNFSVWDKIRRLLF